MISDVACVEKKQKVNQFPVSVIKVINIDKNEMFYRYQLNGHVPKTVIDLVTNDMSKSR